MHNIARLVPRKCRRLVFVAALLITAVILLVSLMRETDFNQGISASLKQVNDPFGSSISRHCDSSVFFSRRQYRSNTPLTESTVNRKKFHDICFDPVLHQMDIQMEEVWDVVNVGYPSLVLSVTGWLDTIQVRSWTAKPLHVIIVPHSHQDPGWLSTLDTYFQRNTHPTLDLVVDKLITNPSWKFIWSEVVLLKMWWNTASDARKRQFKRLVEIGQLELVSGGWVMTDESVSHYAAMLDQLMEGHIWLKDNLNVTIENSWAVDPFGHSSTMAYLLGQANIRNMVIQRTHFAIKRHFAARKSLEFFWRQVWDDRGKNDVFCHMMPFLLYSIPHSCGPERHVCCKFDFNRKQCFHGNKLYDQVNITDKNVADIATEFWEQLQKKSELFRSNVVLVPHGDDFRYSTSKEWEDQFGNIQRIMDYINNDPVMRTKIQFGTLKDYFNKLETTLPGSRSIRYPVLSGDFFPYSDRGEQYWSGFYTTRPFFKYLVRQLQQLLRSAEFLFTFSLSAFQVNSNMTSLYTQLEAARRTLALVQHHDAITGTSKQAVMADFRKRVHEAILETQNVQTNSVSVILTRNNRGGIVLNQTEAFLSEDAFSKSMLLRVNKAVNIIVWNDLGQPRHDIVHVVVDTPDVQVTDSLTRIVPHQISPIWDKETHINIHQYKLSLEVHIEAFSLAVFTVSPIAARSSRSTAKLYNITHHPHQHNWHPAYRIGHFQVQPVQKPHHSISNVYLNATFKACDGMLLFVHHLAKDDVYKADVHFVTYSTGRHTHPFRDKSGPYIFLPDGVAKDLQGEPEVIVTEGNLFSEVRAIYKDIVHVSRIYYVTGPIGKGVHVENYVNIGTSEWDNREIVMRIETDIVNLRHHFCTDSNGYQILRRKTRTKMTIQGNVYPMTTTAILEDYQSRFTLLSAQSHGVSSLVTGWLEVVLDRRLLQGDWRGLSENLTDNVLSKSSFLLLFETKDTLTSEKTTNDDHFCLPSMLSHFLTEALNSPMKTFSTLSSTQTSTYTSSIRLGPTLPCGWHLMNARTHRLAPKEAFLVIQRSGLDCTFQDDMSCLSKHSLEWSDFQFNISDVIEMSLTGHIEKKTQRIDDSIDLEPMQIKTFKIAFR